MKPETGIFEKISKNGKYIKNIQLGQIKLKPGQNNLFRSLNGLRSGIKGHMGPTWIKKKE